MSLWHWLSGLCFSIAGWASPDYTTREATQPNPWLAYPVLVRAEQHPDPEVRLRARLALRPVMQAIARAEMFWLLLGPEPTEQEFWRHPGRRALYERLKDVDLPGFVYLPNLWGEYTCPEDAFRTLQEIRRLRDE